MAESQGNETGKGASNYVHPNSGLRRRATSETHSCRSAKRYFSVYGVKLPGRADCEVRVNSGQNLLLTGFLNAGAAAAHAARHRLDPT